MTSRTTNFTALLLAVAFALALPFAASAQYNRGGWGRNDDRYERRQDHRGLREVTRRLHRHSEDFQRNLDRSLDRSRIDGTRREDRINDIARDFSNAADRLRDKIGDGDNLNRSADEARRVLQLGERIDQFVARANFNSRVQSDWSQIRQQLRFISDVYGYRRDLGRDNYGDYNSRGDYDSRGSRRSSYPRNW